DCLFVRSLLTSLVLLICLVPQMPLMAQSAAPASLEARHMQAFIASKRQAAEQGDPDAQYALGMFYSGAGDFMPADDSESMSWIRKEDVQGHTNAQFRLGVAYLSEIGVARSDTEATRWMRKAAEQNTPGDEYWLGFMAAFVACVPKDQQVALSWYRTA